MPTLAAAFASSHSVMLTCTLEDWQGRFLDRDRRLGFFDREGGRITYDDLLARAPADAIERVKPEAAALRLSEVQRAMKRLAGDIAAARLDALVVIGDDQHELFDERIMPTFGVYYGETIANGVQRPSDDWYVKAQMRRLEPQHVRQYPCDARLALSLIAGLMARGFDITALSGLRDGQYEGHAFSFIHRLYMDEAVVPIVPVFLNTFYPPNQPTPMRCLELGRAIREIVEAQGGEHRIGIMASGGLSHFQTEVDLDEAVISALRARDTESLARLDPRRLQSGSSEIRNWIVLAGALEGLQLDWLSYTPGYRTPALTGTGLAFATWSRRF